MTAREESPSATPMGASEAPKNEDAESTTGSPRRRAWLSGIAAATLIPAAFFGLVELLLALLGYGHATEFFVRGREGQGYTSNPRFGWRFFPPSIARTPERFRLQVKPPGTYRVFVLGGSAALGDPEPAFGLSRFLDVLLRERGAEAPVEVVNAAMVAINSHVVRAIANDCAHQDPDLFVVFLGNNEVVGPYGAGTVFADYSPNLAIIRTGLWLRTTRWGQLIANHVNWRADRARLRWRGMEMFQEQITNDDPRLNRVIAHFRSNLEDICESAQSVGASVVLLTVPVNLRDQAPFASTHSRNLSRANLERWNKSYGRGVEREEAGDLESAIAGFSAAAEIDDHFADLHFRLGRCFLTLGNLKRAQESFSQARDLDALRFRADSRINQTIREVAQAFPGVYLVDAEADFAARALLGDTPGNEFFYEHVHLNLEGNYQLARLVDAKISEIRGTPLDVSPLSRNDCARRLAWTPWDEHRALSYIFKLTRRAPFTQGLDHRKRLDTLAEYLGLLAGEIAGNALDASLETYRQARGGRAHDLLFRGNYALLLNELGFVEEALEEWRHVERAIPDSTEAHLNLGLLLVRQGKVEEAVGHYEKVLASKPTADKEVQAHFNLGIARSSLSRGKQAEAHYESALAIDPDHAKAHNNLALLLRTRGEIEAAIGHFREAIRAQPERVESHYNLGATFVQQGKIRQATIAFEKAVRADPESVPARLDYGKGLIQLGRLSEAAAQFIRIVELDADHAIARRLLGFIRLKEGRLREAERYFSEAVRLKPDFAAAHNGLGTALAAQGKLDDAIPHFEEAVRLNPHDAQARRNLDAALERKRND